ncbi:FtsX-like permease family protein [Spirillospora sp. CA-294931]|uniref:FtsX-like permease family protein n=1 Tax=Spirillospora sp. CA-294931 TaxID=3240042 RepID=UPI003D915EED
MFRIAMRSVRKRTGSFVASFLAMFLGAIIVMAFGSMLDIAGGDGVPDTAKETLFIMGNVVGGWGLILVVFAVVSTLTLSVRQRGAEMALLKSVGATPAQLGRMIVGEAAALAVVAAALAVVPAMVLGRGLLGMLHGTDQVPDSVGYSFGPIALSIGIGVTFLSAVAAAAVTARRVARTGINQGLDDTGSVRMTKKRVIFAGIFLALALDLAVVTSTVMKDKGTDAMATSGQADIFAALGLALLAPWFLRRIVGAVAPALQRMGGISGALAASTLLRRNGQMASAVTPIILFTGIGVGTLYLQEIENNALAAAGMKATVESKNIETLNFVVIGMIVLFTAIMLVNTLIAATTYRRREFGQQRLTGATPGQVLGAVVLESTVLTVTGVALGSVAALFTIIPFSIARTGDALPEGDPGMLLAVAAIAAVLTLATAYGTARRVVSTPAVEAVSV